MKQCHIKIIEIIESTRKSRYAKEVLESLPEWFGNKQAVDAYAENVSALPFWAAVEPNDRCVGFFAVKTHYGNTGEIYVCGILPEYHCKGIGKALYTATEEHLVRNGCKYVIVKTLSDTDTYEPYARTRAFFKSVGFEPLITLTEMWDEENPCLIMIKTLRTD